MWYILAVRFKSIASKHKELITTPTQKDTLNKRINLIYILYKHTNTYTHIPAHARNLQFLLSNLSDKASPESSD